MDLDHSSDQKCSCEGERAELEPSRGRLPLDWFLAFPHRMITTQSQKVQEPVSARQNRSEPWKEKKERRRNGTFQPRVFLPAAHVSKRAVAGIFMDHPTSPSAGPPMPIALNALAIYRLGATTTRGGLRVQTPGGVKKSLLASPTSQVNFGMRNSTPLLFLAAEAPTPHSKSPTKAEQEVSALAQSNLFYFFRPYFVYDGFKCKERFRPVS